MVIALGVMPLYANGLSNPCSCSVEGNQSDSLAEHLPSDSCCSMQSEQPENDDSRTPPCEDQDCPSTCCAMSVYSAFVSPTIDGMVQSFSDNSVAWLYDEVDLLQPHLLRLKRPPRTV